MIEDIKTVKDGVIYCLKNFPATRNSDKELVLRYLFENKLIARMKDGFSFKYNNIDDFPAFESITRCRRKLQEAGRFLATEDVEEQRRLEEQNMKNIDDWF